MPLDPDDFAGRPAASVDQVADRFLRLARDTKEQLMAHLHDGVLEGRNGRMLRDTLELALIAYDMGHLVASGKLLPDRYRLEPEQHFDEKGEKVPRSKKLSRSPE